MGKHVSPASSDSGGAIIAEAFRAFVAIDKASRRASRSDQIEFPAANTRLTVQPLWP
jgi:hypothetical protein